MVITADMHSSKVLIAKKRKFLLLQIHPFLIISLHAYTSSLLTNLLSLVCRQWCCWIDLFCSWEQSYWLLHYTKVMHVNEWEGWNWSSFFGFVNPREIAWVRPLKASRARKRSSREKRLIATFNQLAVRAWPRSPFSSGILMNELSRWNMLFWYFSCK